MQISLESEPYNAFTLLRNEKKLVIPDKHIVVDVSNTIYSGYNITLKQGYCTLETAQGCIIECSHNSFVRCKRNCIIKAGIKSHIITGDECQVILGLDSYIKIGSNCNVKVSDGCIIHMNNYINLYKNIFDLGNNNTIILKRFDDIKKNTFTKYGTGNVIIGEDGTRILMDKSFKNLLKMCD